MTTAAMNERANARAASTIELLSTAAAVAAAADAACTDRASAGSGDGPGDVVEVDV